MKWSAILLAAFCAAPLINAAAQVPEAREPGITSRQLFRAVVSPAGCRQRKDANVQRRRPVRMDLPLLRSARAGDTLDLELFDDLSLRVHIESAETKRRGSTEVWRGRIEDEPHGLFTCVWCQGVAAASIRAPRRGSFQLRIRSGDVYEIQQIDESIEEGCLEGRTEEMVHSPRKPRDLGPLVRGGEGDPGGGEAESGAWDVMVLFTQKAANEEGGPLAMGALIELAVSESDSMYGISGVPHRLELVYMAQVDYDETGISWEDRLSCLRQTSDGCIDEIHDWRDLCGADLVSLWIERDSGDGIAGIAHVMTTLSNAFKDRAFSVVNRSSAVGNYSFVHELGHNMGCKHSYDDKSGDEVFNYSYGYYFTGDTGDWRTIMNKKSGYTRLPRFSNPFNTRDGVPTGIYDPPAFVEHCDNAQSLDNVGATVAGWRSTANPQDDLWVDFDYTGMYEWGLPDYPFNTIGEAMAIIAEGGTIHVVSGSSSETPVMMLPFTVVLEGTGNVVIGN